MNDNILVIQTAFIGDTILSIPLLKRLRLLYPKSQIHFLTRKGMGSFLEKLNFIDRKHEIEKKEGRVLGWNEIRNELKKINFKLIVSPHESFRTAGLVAQLKAEEKIGFYKWWNFFAFRRRIRRSMHLPESLRQLALVADIDPEIKEELLGFIENETWRRGSSSSLSQMERLPDGFVIPDWASLALNENQIDLLVQNEGSQRMTSEEWGRVKNERIVFFAPGSVWKTKMWGSDKFIELGRSLAKQGYTIVTFGAQNEFDLCELVSRRIEGAMNFAGKTDLLGSLAMMKYGCGIVCNDSGGMHVASMLNLPTVAVFGPTVLDFGYRPWQDHAEVAQVDLSCRPCGLHGGNSCPIGTHDCMNKVDVLQVERQLLGLVEKQGEYSVESD